MPTPQQHCFDRLAATEPDQMLRRLAQIRRKQLDLAMRGEILASARYASCARGVRESLSERELAVA